LLAQFGVAEMARNGITTFNDMYRNQAQTYKASSHVGLNAFLCKGVMDIAGESAGKHSIEEARELEKSIPKENFLYSIHGLYTCSADYAKEQVQYAVKHKMRFHMHFCEDEQEVATIKKKHNVEHPTQCLEKYGFAKLPKLLLAHTVILDDYDFEVLEKMKDIVTCVHCPISNAKIGCGTAQVMRLLKLGINVSLGTDGQGTGNNMDMLELMRYTLLTQRN
jgi:5-methylthioadenosine/S-adenosylhomocysteine deaminase